MFSPAVPFASLGSDIFRVSRDIRYGQYARLVLSFLNQRVRRCRHLDGRPQAPSVWLSKLFDKKHRRSVDVILPIFGRRLTMSCAWLSCLYGEVSEVCVLQGQLDNIPVENRGWRWAREGGGEPDHCRPFKHFCCPAVTAAPASIGYAVISITVCHHPILPEAWVVSTIVFV